MKTDGDRLEKEKIWNRTETAFPLLFPYSPIVSSPGVTATAAAAKRNMLVCGRQFWCICFRNVGGAEKEDEIVHLYIIRFSEKNSLFHPSLSEIRTKRRMTKKQPKSSFGQRAGGRIKAGQRRIKRKI